VSLPQTIEDVVNACTGEVERRVVQVGYIRERSRTRDIAQAVLEAAGIRIDDDGKTLIYPSTVGTSTPRYQVARQRNARWKGQRR
jgi:hypothetical protein